MAWPTISDYQEAIQFPKYCFVDSALRSGQPTLTNLGLPKAVTGNFAGVYQVKCQNAKYAIRCFLVFHQDQQKRYDAISQYLCKCQIPCMVDFQYVSQGIRVKNAWYPILKMQWIDGVQLNTFIEKNLGNSAALNKLALDFVRTIAELRKHSIAHGDLQHGNIIIANNAIRLIDYDGMFVPGLKGLASHEIGHSNYQHPLRSEQDYGPFLDNFSAWIIYLSLICLSIDATLWNRVSGGDEKLLLGKSDLQNPLTSQVINILEKSADPRLALIADKLNSFLYISDVASIPPLEESALPDLAQITSTPRSPRPRHQGSTSNDWIVTHQPITPRVINHSYFYERLSVSFLPIIVLLLLFFRFSNISVALSVPAYMLILSFFFFKRFSSLPETRLKAQLQEKYVLAKTELNMEDISILKIDKELDKLEETERKHLSDYSISQKDLVLKERKDIEQANKGHNDILLNINAQLSNLTKTEDKELENELLNMQRSFLVTRLSGHNIFRSSIPGIGNKLKQLINNYGIMSAADIINVHISKTGTGRYYHDIAYIEVNGRGNIHVDGIGPKKARELLAWKSALLAHYQRLALKTLPQANELTIKQKYLSKKRNLEQQEKAAQQNILQKRSEIVARYQKEQSAIAAKCSQLKRQVLANKASLETLRVKRNEIFCAKAGEVHRLKREFCRYQNISLHNFYKQIFFVN